MKIKYPKKFKSTQSSLVVEFTSLTTGAIVTLPDNSKYFPYSVGDYAEGWFPHTNTTQWEEVIEMTELETLKKQVTEMQETIARMEQEEINSKVSQWEPKGGKWFVAIDGGVCISTSDNDSKNFGTEYPSQKQAEWASKQMRKFNRLLCYVAENTNNIPEDIGVSATSFTNCVSVFVKIDQEDALVLNDKIQSGEVIL